jgi:uncharacterized protein (DUF305 family)
MTRQPSFCLRTAVLLGALAAFTPSAVARGQTAAPIIQPGAPGEGSRLITPEKASALAGMQHTEADVRFVRGMIAHHAQALDMVDLLETRSEREVMRQLGRRIELSQEDEIRMMQEWLRARSLEVPAADSHHAHGAHEPGMLTAEQMTQLSQATGIEFDRLFLELMIQHHRGALTMVENLLAQQGAAQDPQLFAFTADITDDQSSEIDRMDVMLREISPDPRAHLKAGFLDAGEASMNMERVAALSKPAGFFDPNAPAGRPIPPERRPDRPSDRRRETREAPGPDAAGDKAAAEKAKQEEERRKKEEEEDDRPRPGMLSFANSDLAFAGDLVIQGNYHGFNTFHLEEPSRPHHVASVVCPGGQGDVSIHKNLLFMSVEQTSGRLDCGLQGVADPASKERFRGVRIFDITDIRMPKQVAAIQTCRGSHTHTLVTDPDDEGNIYLYGSGTGSVRPSEELGECSEAAADPRTSLYSIDVIRVPVARPAEARIVSRPRIFADPETGAIAGLWKGGDHGPGTQRTSETNRCHDITVFPELKLAAGACSGNGILLDISDPEKPVRLDQVSDPAFAFWHSATFNNDGTKIVFTDEWGGGSRPRCRPGDPRNWGANAIFDIVDRKLQFRSYYKLPSPQTDQENCVAHNGSLVPVPGRDIMAQAWYQGGITVFDFSDSAKPVEIAFFDRGPIDAKQLTMGGYWSAYWYEGFIYGSEIARGLDVLKLVPSEYLTKNEIDAAALVKPGVFNAQQQHRIEWPAVPVVARAYIDQLERSRALAPERVSTLRSALDRADQALAGKSPAAAEAGSDLAELAAGVRRGVEGASERDKARMEALADTLEGIAARIRK